MRVHCYYSSLAQILFAWLASSIYLMVVDTNAKLQIHGLLWGLRA